MASYPAPTGTSALFNSSLFPTTTGGDALTYEIAKSLFLEYPSAQGTENLLAINVAGSSDFTSSVVISDGASSTVLQQDETNNVLNITGDILVEGDFGITDGTGTSAFSQQGNNFYINNATSGGDIIIGAGGQSLMTFTTVASPSSSVINFSTTLPPTCSATQPDITDSSTKIPTTAWVQSVVNRMVVQDTIPYISGTTLLSKSQSYDPATTTDYLFPFFHWANASQMDYNEVVTVRFNITSFWDGANDEPPQKNQTTTGYIDIFPARIINTSLTFPNTYYPLNNVIGGNTNYNLFTTPYAQHGRPYWCYNVVTANDTTDAPIYIGAYRNNTTTEAILGFIPHNGAYLGSYNTRFSICFEIINQGNTSYGLPTITFQDNDGANNINYVDDPSVIFLTGYKSSGLSFSNFTP